MIVLLYILFEYMNFIICMISYLMYGLFDFFFKFQMKCNCFRLHSNLQRGRLPTRSDRRHHPGAQGQILRRGVQ